MSWQWCRNQQLDIEQSWLVLSTLKIHRKKILGPNSLYAEERKKRVGHRPPKLVFDEMLVDVRPLQRWPIDGKKMTADIVLEIYSKTNEWSIIFQRRYAKEKR